MTRRKIILSLIILPIIGYLLAATPVFAAGLVPCGGPGEKMCTVCDIFVLIKNIINLILYIFAPLATLMAIYVAYLFMFSGGSPKMVSDAKGKLWILIWGIFWVLGSWLVLNTILNFLADRRAFPWPWNQVNCTVSKPSSGKEPSSPSTPAAGGAPGDSSGGGNWWEINIQGIPEVPGGIILPGGACSPDGAVSKGFICKNGEWVYE